ncbi:MAG: alpha/beta hydrolase family protein [Desulfovibrionaceae bacterium]
MKRIVPLFCLFFCLLCGIPCAAAPAGKLHNAGFRTIGIWQQEQQLRLDINVWYPTARRPADLNYSPWTLHAARNAPPREGRFPVILLSHATAGTRFSYHELAAWLARNGFVVAAPTHPGDNMDDMHALYTLEQLSGRVHHLRTTLDILAGDAQLGPVLDLDRVGVAGFQAGATAALLMGGAGLDAAGWQRYCTDGKRDEHYCSRWAEQRISGLIASLPLRTPLEDARVKAVAAISPMYGMLLTAKALRSCTAGVLLVETEEDLHGGSANTLLADRFPRPPALARLPQANEGGLMSACPRALAEELPELCHSVTPEQRLRLHHQLRGLLVSFFTTTLTSASAPHEAVLPPEPALFSRH